MRVEIYADVLCPWCFIGKRRIAAASAQLTDRGRVEIVWRSYELSPNEGRIPGPTAAEAMRGWWADQAPAKVAHIRALGAEEGLELNLHLARPVNTFDAHRLSHLGGDCGRADEVMEHLLRAYHTEARNVADPHVLERVGVEAGLDTSEVSELLAGDAYAKAVRADEHRATKQGVTGVPAVVIDGGPPVSGVRPIAELRKLLEDAVNAARAVSRLR